MRSKTKGLALLTLMTMLTTACSSDGGGGSKESFVKGATTICRRVHSETSSAGSQLFGLRPTNPELAELIGQVVPALEKGFDDLRNVAPPKGDEATIRAVLAAGDEEVERFKAVASRAADSDPSAVDDFYKIQPFAGFKQQAGAYGLSDCGVQQDTGDQGGTVTDNQRDAFTAEKKAFIQKGDAACEELGGDKTVIDPVYSQYFRSGEPPPSLDTLVALLPQFGFFFSQAVQRLRGVEPPPADKSLLTSILSQYDVLLTKEQAGLASAGAGDRSGFRRSFSDVAAMSNASDRALREYGFTKCAPSRFLLFGVVVQRAPRLP